MCAKPAKLFNLSLLACGFNDDSGVDVVQVFRMSSGLVLHFDWRKKVRPIA